MNQFIYIISIKNCSVKINSEVLLVLNFLSIEAGKGLISLFV